MEKAMRTNNAELSAALKNFTGTETWFRHEIYRLFTYTEGVQFLAEKTGASWLIDLIFSRQYAIPAVRAEPFQCWKLMVKDFEGTLSCEDGMGQQVYSMSIEFTDFPMEEISLWFTDSVLLLPS